ncbi:Nonaspanin [Trema orientale]|uniref:Transmembrane 9 superfamily member n=1 Tax=Trema orientale TaxID=63057 RepID=A0A2P5BTG0_TREOI|nr:Nonaspanin [Trema orientale]
MCTCWDRTRVQILGTNVLTIVFAALGFLPPGEWITILLILWLLIGIFAGYSSARLYKMFYKTEWKKIAMTTALMFPTTILVVLLSPWKLSSPILLVAPPPSGSTTLIFAMAILVLWCVVLISLVFFGAYIGFYKKPAAIENPVKTNKIPRPIPDRKTWLEALLNPAFSILTMSLFGPGAGGAPGFFLFHLLIPKMQVELECAFYFGYIVFVPCTVFLLSETIGLY